IGTRSASSIGASIATVGALQMPGKPAGGRAEKDRRTRVSAARGRPYLAAMPFPDLPAVLGNALAARGYSDPTPVQAAVLAPAAAGRDLIVSAQTGSGKTVAFGLAMAGELLRDDGTADSAGGPLALVIAPTRELALQVSRELVWLY